MALLRARAKLARSNPAPDVSPGCRPGAGRPLRPLLRPPFRREPCLHPVERGSAARATRRSDSLHPHESPQSGVTLAGAGGPGTPSAWCRMAPVIDAQAAKGDSHVAIGLGGAQAAIGRSPWPGELQARPRGEAPPRSPGTSRAPLICWVARAGTPRSGACRCGTSSSRTRSTSVRERPPSCATARRVGRIAASSWTTRPGACSSRTRPTTTLW